MKKVVYICFVPLTRSMLRDYHIHYLLEKNVTVEYWDITALYFGALDVPDRAEGGFIKVMRSFQDVKSALKKEDIHGTVFILLLAYGYRTMRLMRLLTSKRCQLAFFGFNSYPGVKRRDMHKLAQILRSLSQPEKWLMYVQRIISAGVKRFNLIKPFDVVFCAGQREIDRFDKHSRVVSVNYFDYDAYLRARGEHHTLVSGRYCVFLDSNLTHHPDVKALGLKTVDPGRYYDALNRFFKTVEEKYGLRVVIAAHPKAQYAVNPFENRKIIWYKPHELVRDSVMVLTFGSFSISYAVLYRKPLAFLTSGDIYQHMDYYYYETEACAADLSAPLIDIDKGLPPGADLLSMNPDRYEKYKYTYLTSKESENRLSGEIVFETLSSLQ